MAMAFSSEIMSRTRSELVAVRKKKARQNRADQARTEEETADADDAG